MAKKIVKASGKNRNGKRVSRRTTWIVWRDKAPQQVADLAAAVAILERQRSKPLISLYDCPGEHMAAAAYENSQQRRDEDTLEALALVKQYPSLETASSKYKYTEHLSRLEVYGPR